MTEIKPRFHVVENYVPTPVSYIQNKMNPNIYFRKTIPPDKRQSIDSSSLVGLLVKAFITSIVASYY
jgi:hypothetical protein